jgi:hypothetical protein
MHPFGTFVSHSETTEGLDCRLRICDFRDLKVSALKDKPKRFYDFLVLGMHAYETAPAALNYFD